MIDFIELYLYMILLFVLESVHVLGHPSLAEIKAFFPGQASSHNAFSFTQSLPQTVYMCVFNGHFAKVISFIIIHTSLQLICLWLDFNIIQLTTSFVHLLIILFEFQISVMQQELVELRPKLIETSRETVELIEIIEKETVEVEEKKKIVEVDEAVANQAANAAKEIKVRAAY